MVERTGVVQKHVGEKLVKLKTGGSRKMQPQQPDQVNPKPRQNKACQPTKEIDNYQIFSDYRDTAEKPKPILIHLLCQFFVAKV
jgi:hypothetical protein